MESLLINLKCTNCGDEFMSEEKHTTCPSCGKVLFPCYDLDKAREQLKKSEIQSRPRSFGMWRWFELLPIRDKRNIVTLGEGDTPLLPARNLGKPFGASHLFIKQEGINPTGTFKARGLAAAVSKANELGVKRIAMPSAGNAGAALSAYGARAGMHIFVFIPEDTPELIKKEISIYGTTGYLVKGLITDAGKIVRENASENDWYDVSTLKEPYRVDGKKTLGFEIAEQLNWHLPDAIIYPAGGGTGIVGMWKAFDELEKIGWIDSKRPKMIVVQSEGCAPIVSAFKEGKAHADMWQNAHTIAGGIRVPAAIGDYLILNAVRQSGGTAVAVSDTDILDSMKEISHSEGVFAGPEGAATFAAYKKLLSESFLKPEDEVVLFNTGAGLKTTELVQGEYLVLDPKDPDLSKKINPNSK